MGVLNEKRCKIQNSYTKDQLSDANKKIKQLIWQEGFLVSDQYISFTFKEQQLLYDSLILVLCENNTKNGLKNEIYLHYIMKEKSLNYFFLSKFFHYTT